MKINKNELPKKWATTTVGGIYKVVGGGTPATNEPAYWGNGVDWITSADIIGIREISPKKKLTRAGVANSPVNVVPAGTILVVTRVGLGKVAIASSELAFSQDIQGLIQSATAVEPAYSLQYLRFTLERLKYEGRGTTISGITKKQLLDVEIPIPPLKEQCRIVAKIDELFSELDKGVESLVAARDQIKAFRQSVLKAAFEGKMTGEWRAQRGNSIESASTLVERIRFGRIADRDKGPTRLLSKVNEATAMKRQRSDLSIALSADELGQLPELPDTWVWTKLGEIFSVFVGATPSRQRTEFWGGSIRWVSSGEVRFERIRETKEMITDIGLANTSTIVHPPGTVLLAMIGEGKTRGQAAILDVPACHNQNSAAIRISGTNCVPEYLYWYLQYRYQVTRMLGSGNNQKALNKERVSNMALPLAPIEEQREIVAQIEAKMSVVDHIDSDIEIHIERLEMLRQSILRCAFSGRLVEQFPAEEPASFLLERIRAERDEGGLTKRRNDKSGKKVAT